MADRHIEAVVEYLTSLAHCTEDVIESLHEMRSAGIDPTHEGIKRGDLEDIFGLDLDYEPDTILDDNAVEANLVERDPEDADDLRAYIIAEWRDEIVNGEVTDAAEEAIDAIIDHMNATDPGGDTTAVADGGITHRDVLANEFDLDQPAAVEVRLQRGDQVNNVNRAVEAIEENGAVNTRGDYGKFTFRYEAYRYRLTSLAVELYRL